MEITMLKQQHMTEIAETILHFLPFIWTTPKEVSQITGVTTPRCQFILTQLEMAGFVEGNREKNNSYKRCEKSQ